MYVCIYVCMYIDTSDEPVVFKSVIEASAEGFVPRDIIFKVMIRDETGCNIEVAPTTAVLMEKYWSREIMITMVEAGNAYRANRLKQEPDLRMWLDKKNTRTFTLACVYQFIVMLYYFGIAQLPCKNYYWLNEKYMPTHQTMSELHITREWFKFIWRNFHFQTLENILEILQEKTKDDISIVKPVVHPNIYPNGTP